jgi:ATP-dependent DNA helicase RecG
MVIKNMRVAMPDQILKIDEKIAFMIEIGESHFREFKSCYHGSPGKKQNRPKKSIAVDIAETLVAFANADGGDLLVGVEDDGTITGVPFTEDVISYLLDAPRANVFKETPLPSFRGKKIYYNNILILYFSVPAGTDYCYLTSDGRCLQRKDLESVPVSSEYLKASRRETVSREYDRQYVLSSSLKDLNLDIISNIAEQISSGMSVEKCLQYLDLAEFGESELKLKRAALLLFAKNIAKWHPRSQVRLLKVDGTELKTGKEYNVVYDDEVTNNIIELIESSWDLIRPHLVETRLYDDAKFKTQIIYPELACREALINAIAHRDYSIEGRGIEVTIYNDRFDINSPGGLLSSISIKDLRELRGVHQSRNSLIARALREIGYMRELGEGMRRIFKVIQENDLRPPDIDSNSERFSIRLHQKFVYSKEEKLWLENFNHIELTRDEKTVIRLGYDTHIISPREIWEACGIVDTEYYRKLIEGLYKKGILIKAKTHNAIITEARTKRLPKKQIARYKIQKPEEIRPSIKAESFDEGEYSKIFIGNISPGTSQGDLINTFSPLGDIADVIFPVDFITARHKGFAFIEFDKRSQAESIIKRSNKIELNGRKLYLSWAKPREHIKK